MQFLAMTKISREYFLAPSFSSFLKNDKVTGEKLLGSRQRLYILLLIRFIRIDAFFNGDRINVGRFSLIEALIINTKKNSIIHHVVSKIHFLFLLHMQISICILLEWFQYKIIKLSGFLTLYIIPKQFNLSFLLSRKNYLKEKKNARKIKYRNGK